MILRAVVRDALVRATRAKEALDDGDRALATEILNDLARDLGQVLEPGRRCERCGRRFRWPGDLEHHFRVMHWRDAT